MPAPKVKRTLERREKAAQNAALSGAPDPLRFSERASAEHYETEEQALQAARNAQMAASANEELRQRQGMSAISPHHLPDVPMRPMAGALGVSAPNELSMVNDPRISGQNKSARYNEYAKPVTDKVMEYGVGVAKKIGKKLGL